MTSLSQGSGSTRGPASVRYRRRHETAPHAVQRAFADDDAGLVDGVGAGELPTGRGRVVEMPVELVEVAVFVEERAPLVAALDARDADDLVVAVDAPRQRTPGAAEIAEVLPGASVVPDGVRRVADDVEVGRAGDVPLVVERQADGVHA